jgi:hypothetical protein
LDEFREKIMVQSLALMLEAVKTLETISTRLHSKTP